MIVLDNNFQLLIIRMKFTDTMSSFKYMGGALPLHAAMLYYGLHISQEDEYIYRLNKECEHTFTKMDLDDVDYMMIAHIVCICVMAASTVLRW